MMQSGPSETMTHAMSETATTGAASRARTHVYPPTSCSGRARPARRLSVDGLSVSPIHSARSAPSIRPYPRERTEAMLMLTLIPDQGGFMNPTRKTPAAVRGDPRDLRARVKGKVRHLWIAPVRVRDMPRRRISRAGKVPRHKTD